VQSLLRHNSLATQSPTRLDENLFMLQQLVSVHSGVTLNTHTDFSRRSFDALTIENQNMILSTISRQAGILRASRASDLGTGGWLDGEIAMVQQAAALYRLQISEDFLQKISYGDVVEIYDIEKQVQIYRNLEFLKKSSYDLLTLLVTPYTQLFFREPHFEKLLMERTGEILATAKGATPWNIEDHYLVERLHNHNRMFRVSLGYASPVFNIDTGHCIALATTMRCECVGSSQAGSNVSPL
jgi:hypothetical protein